MSETALLYALSTLAQTCAALAAFVGAVGVFRLQVLREQRRTAEQDLRMLAHELGIGRLDVPVVPLRQVVELVRRTDRDVPAREALHRWEAFVPRIRQSRWALIVFEVWNLIVIGAALIGFNYLSAMTCARWTSWALWVVALITVFVTLSCVIVWTRRVEE